jgi:hypothetical protein
VKFQDIFQNLLNIIPGPRSSLWMPLVETHLQHLCNVAKATLVVLDGDMGIEALSASPLTAAAAPDPRLKELAAQPVEQVVVDPAAEALEGPPPPRPQPPLLGEFLTRVRDQLLAVPVELIQDLPEEHDVPVVPGDGFRPVLRTADVKSVAGSSVKTSRPTPSVAGSTRRSVVVGAKVQGPAPKAFFSNLMQAPSK